VYEVVSVKTEVGRSDKFSILPLDEVFEVLRDQDTQLVLDHWNVLGVGWASPGNLVILKTLSSLIVAPSPKTL